MGGRWVANIARSEEDDASNRLRRARQDGQHFYLRPWWIWVPSLNNEQDKERDDIGDWHIPAVP